MSHVLVVAGIAIRDGRLLLLRRPEDGACPGLWEFPGGKIEPGETPFDALAREWTEEIGVTVAGAEPFAFSTGDAGGRPLILLFFKVTAFSGEPAALLPGSSLRWSPAEEAALLAMPAPDAPVLASLIRDGNGAFKSTETPAGPCAGDFLRRLPVVAARGGWAIDWEAIR
jgi:8-oxo-dGTP diphosphatase